MVRGYPERIGSGTSYVARSSPCRNGFAESFHSKHRVGFVGREEFENEPQAQALGLLSKDEDDTERPNHSLGCKTPAEFAAICARYVPIAEGLMDTEQKDRWFALSLDQEMRRRSMPGSRGARPATAEQTQPRVTRRRSRWNLRISKPRSDTPGLTW